MFQYINEVHAYKSRIFADVYVNKTKPEMTGNVVIYRLIVNNHAR